MSGSLRWLPRSSRDRVDAVVCSCAATVSRDRWRVVLCSRRSGPTPCVHEPGVGPGVLRLPRLQHGAAAVRGAPRRPLVRGRPHRIDQPGAALPAPPRHPRAVSRRAVAAPVGGSARRRRPSRGASPRLRGRPSSPSATPALPGDRCMTCPRVGCRVHEVRPGASVASTGLSRRLVGFRRGSAGGWGWASAGLGRRVGVERLIRRSGRRPTCAG